MSDYASDWDLSGKHGAFTAAQALYWYCANYHGGQGSTEYRVLSQLQYTPGAMEHEPTADTESVDIYTALAAGELDAENVLEWINVEWEKGE